MAGKDDAKDDSQSGSSARGAQSIDRAATILTFVVGAADPVSFTEVVGQTGISKSTVSRLLQALERNSLLERVEEGRYRGGPLFASYAARFDRIESLAAAADSTLQRLTDETGEAAHLAVASGEQVVQVAQVESTFLLGAMNWLNIDVPPHCSALGKVLYAYHALTIPTGPLERRSAQTIASGQELLVELDDVQHRGYAVTHNELEMGLDGVAAPVFGADDTVIAALGLSGPGFRLDDQHGLLGELLIREAQTLSKTLKRRTNFSR